MRANCSEYGDRPTPVIAGQWSPGDVKDFAKWCAWLLVAVALPSHASTGVNLLTSPSAELASGVNNPLQAETAVELTDGNLAVPATGSRKSFTLVFTFKDVVSPERVRVHLPAAEGDELIGELELLGSLVSADSGYHLLRSAGVTTRRQEQSFDFPMAGVRWLMIRFSAVDAPPQIAISEIEVFGIPGPPVSVYRFNESPAAALEVLQTIGGSLELNIDPAEKDLFADAADGQLDHWTLTDAALLASGVRDEAQRAALTGQIDELEQAFRSTGAATGDPMETGRALLAWLHEGPMRGGYVSKQTDLSTVLTDGTFNCVSSAVLYNILGQRLGLDVRGVEVPDHAFAMVYRDTDYVDVETTTPQGFNPTRDRKAVEAFQATTGFAYIPDRRPDKRRELTPLELVSFIYYNHGVDLADREDYHGALLANFRALSLDPGSNSAVKNALSALANWSVSLLRQDAYAEALDVVRLGLTLAPQDRTLNHNHRAIWQRRLDGAAEMLPAGEFMALVDEAAAELPDAGFGGQQSLYFIKPAESLADAGEWLSAIESITDAMPRVNPASQTELEKYRRNLVLRWSNREIESQQWERALDALDYGHELMPEDRGVAQNIAYVLQEWSEAVYAESGEAAAEEIVVRVSARFPEVGGVQRAGRSYAIRRIQELRDQARYADALDLIGDYRYLVGSDRDFDTLVRSVFDAQADAYLAEDNWLAALGIYQKARISYPDNRQLRQNQVATWHRWAETYMGAGQWSEALGVYGQALESLPDEQSFQKNTLYIAQEWLKDQDPMAESTRELIDGLYDRPGDEKRMSQLVGNYYSAQIEARNESGAFEEALAISETGGAVVRDETEAIKIRRHAWDDRARRLAKEQKWQEAVDVYQAGLEKLPGDKRLTSNAVATWHGWAETYMDQGDWDAAIEIYTRGLEHMPDTGLFKQNIRYCEQERDSR
jgi:tetratricopeptide (TPR) repeat protein